MEEHRGTARSVSVVIPTHNRRGLLQRALRCALNQVSVDVEVIVVNDGSSDDTKDFLDDLTDPRVKAVHNRSPCGTGPARNTGLDACRHPWVAFLDDDDLWGPQRLGAQLDALERTGAGWACSDAVLLNSRLSIVGVHVVPDGLDLSREILRQNVIPGGGSGVLASTGLVRDVGAFDPAVKGAEDWDLWMRLARSAPLVGVSRPDVGYRLHAGNFSRDVVKMTAARDAAWAKYAVERAEVGVTADDEWWNDYVLGQQLAAGRRLPAARAKLAATSSRRPRDVAALLAILVSPRAVERRHHRRLLADYDPARLAVAQTWISEVRDAMGQSEVA